MLLPRTLSTMFWISTAILLSILSSALAHVCDNENSWLDSTDNKCKPCKVCETNFIELSKCSKDTDTMCVYLAALKLDINSIPKPSKWHEREDDGSEKRNYGSKSVGLDHEEEWGTVLVVVIAAALVAVLSAVAVMVARYTGTDFCGGKGAAASKRARLFSRDRLNTTEYMKNLATFDRRLAMDEILEKRQRALYEPQLLQENVYSDEVFVDLSGLSRRLEDDSDHIRSLLPSERQ